MVVPMGRIHRICIYRSLDYLSINYAVESQALFHLASLLGADSDGLIPNGHDSRAMMGFP